MKKDNTVYIGKKPTMNYVSSIVMKLTSGENVIKLKARGNMISKAVDISEIVKNKFLQDVKIKNISIGTEEIESSGDKINVSVIEIELIK